MRADLAPFLADALLAVAGLAVLHGLGLVRPGGRGALAALGLAYITGVAAIGLLAIALLTLGVPASVPTVLVLSALVTGAGLAAGRRRDGRLPSLPSRPAMPPLRGRGADFWFTAGFAGAFGVYALAGFLSAMVTPLTGFDGWSIWTRKARMLVESGGLPDRSSSRARATRSPIPTIRSCIRCGSRSTSARPGRWTPSSSRATCGCCSWPAYGRSPTW